MAIFGSEARALGEPRCTIALYGAAMRLDNPGKYQRIDLGGPCATQDSCACIQGCTGGQDVVDEQQAAARNPAAGLRRHPESALYIGGPRALAQPDLLAGRLDPLEQVEGHRNAAASRDPLRQDRGLVETPRPEPGPMQRYRHQGVG